MHEHCKGEPSYLGEEQRKQQDLKERSLKRTCHWDDTIENKRRMKDEGRFDKFKTEELERRRIDD